MATERELQDWWDRLDTNQRDVLQSAAAEYRLDDAEVARVLAETGCPVGPVNTGWETDRGPARPGYTGVLPEYVGEFILAQ